MDDAMIANRSRTQDSTLPAQRQAFEVLQELTRHGYVPDAHPLSGQKGILLRHPTAPDLLLREDGTVDVPLNQRSRMDAPATPLTPVTQRKIMWRRGLLFLAVLAITTLLSLTILITIVNNS